MRSTKELLFCFNKWEAAEHGIRALHKALIVTSNFMDTVNITGKWVGVITYGEKYQQLSGKQLFFEAELGQHGRNIDGVSVDTGGVGVNPTPAKLIGTLAGRKISFVKNYEAQSHLEKNGEEKIDYTKPGLDIFYSGDIDTTAQIITGIWEYRVKVRLLYIFQMTLKVGGTWKMERS
jgi:hypothetical protein